MNRKQALAARDRLSTAKRIGLPTCHLRQEVDTVHQMVADMSKVMVAKHLYDVAKVIRAFYSDPPRKQELNMGED